MNANNVIEIFVYSLLAVGCIALVIAICIWSYKTKSATFQKYEATKVGTDAALELYRQIHHLDWYDGIGVDHEEKLLYLYIKNPIDNLNLTLPPQINGFNVVVKNVGQVSAW